jgi:hypothetical protein
MYNYSTLTDLEGKENMRPVFWPWMRRESLWNRWIAAGWVAGDGRALGEKRKLQSQNFNTEDTEGTEKRDQRGREK